MSRKLTPELLDELAADDPQAMRSRCDLRLINTLMGNYRFLRRTLATYRKEGERVTELGAGDGKFSASLAGPVHAFDLQPAPPSFPHEWISGDLFETLQADPQGVLLANLILHHFTDDDLPKLGGTLRKFRVLIISEPLRSKWSQFLSFFLKPFVNSVTRHDMRVSIEAGFRQRELVNLLGLSDGWNISLTASLLGGYRLVALKTS